MKTPMIKLWWLFCGLLIISLVVGCAGDDDDDDQTGDDDTADDDDDDNADTGEQAYCDRSAAPIVFAHGFLEVGDAFSNQTMRFTSNGYCLDRIYAFDWDTLTGYDRELERLGEFIDAILIETGAAKVDLLGHSMGGGLGYRYISEPQNAAKVAHYVHLAGFPFDDVPPDVPILNISSEADTIMGPVRIEGIENIVYEDKDHLEVSTCAQTFEHIYRFFTDGAEPETTEILAQEKMTVSGRALVIAQNTPVVGMEIRIFEIDPATGQRLNQRPEATLITDYNGWWGGFNPRAGAYYEFVCLDPEMSWQPIHYYREPFVRSNNKIYLRVFPPADSVLGLVFKILPYDDSYALFASLNINRAVILGRDTFTIDGYDLAIEGLADPEATTLVVFFFDANFNGSGEGRPAGGIFASFPFIRIFDLIIDSDPVRPIVFNLNGRSLAIRNWKSETEGISIVAFE